MKYQLSDLIDLDELQRLMEALHAATGINHALLDRDGRVLSAAGWKRVCTDFHRVHPRACKRCKESDQYIFSRLGAGPYVGYECQNGLFDYATPVVIDGEHVANIFTGQILHQPPDQEHFRRQAEDFGFNTEAYLGALGEVRVTPRERMPHIMEFLVRLAQDLGTKGLMRLRQLKAEEELQALNSDLSRRIEERTAELSEKNRLLVQKEEKLEQSNDLLQQLNRTLLLLSDANTLVLRAESEERLLPEICRLIVEKGGYPLAWVGFAETDAERSVRPVASFGKVAYLENIRVSWADDEFGRGPTGAAIRTGTTQIVQDNLSAAAMAPWRAETVKHGFRSGISLPLADDGGILGALNIYAAEVEAFGREEVALLEKLAENLAFGIAGLRAKVQLANTNRELQGFTYAASHDIKAPLGRIRSFSSLLAHKYRERLEGDGLLFLDFIQQNARRLTALVEGLLQHAQIEQLAQAIQPVDLVAAVHAAINEKADDIREAGAEIRLDLPAVQVRANPHCLAQALRNLLENALKYSAGAQPPIIAIDGWRLGERHRLAVKDNGIGFDMAYHDRIFEIFRRLHTYEEFPGSGVGLALVRKAVERMGGRVWAESAPGHGATFYLELATAES